MPSLVLHKEFYVLENLIQGVVIENLTLLGTFQA